MLISLRRHYPDQVPRVDAENRASQPAMGTPLREDQYRTAAEGFNIMSTPISRSAGERNGR